MQDSRPRGWLLFLGLILIFAGFLAIGMPFAAAVAVNALVGWFLIIAGAVYCVHAFSSASWGKVFLRVLGGLVYLGVGLLLLVHPLRGVLTLTLILAALFSVEGIFKIVIALQLRPLSNWGWILVNGILAVVIGCLIWMNWPSSAVWAIGLLVGINILFSGMSLVMTAFEG